MTFEGTLLLCREGVSGDESLMRHQLHAANMLWRLVRMVHILSTFDRLAALQIKGISSAYHQSSMEDLLTYY